MPNEKKPKGPLTRLADWLTELTHQLLAPPVVLQPIPVRHSPPPRGGRPAPRGGR